MLYWGQISLFCNITYETICFYWEGGEDMTRFKQFLVSFAMGAMMIGSMAVPVATFAQGGDQVPGISGPVKPINESDLGIQYGANTGLTSTDIRITIARIIKVLMGLLGIVAVVIILIGGFTWMTAGGNDDKVGEAKKMIFSGIIGLAIILSAYAIANFVVSSLVSATTQPV